MKVVKLKVNQRFSKDVILQSAKCNALNEANAIENKLSKKWDDTESELAQLEQLAKVMYLRVRSLKAGSGSCKRLTAVVGTRRGTLHAPASGRRAASRSRPAAGPAAAACADRTSTSARHRRGACTWCSAAQGVHSFRPLLRVKSSAQSPPQSPAQSSEAHVQYE